MFQKYNIQIICSVKGRGNETGTQKNSSKKGENSNIGGREERDKVVKHL